MRVFLFVSVHPLPSLVGKPLGHRTSDSGRQQTVCRTKPQVCCPQNQGSGHAEDSVLTSVVSVPAPERGRPDTPHPRETRQSTAGADIRTWHKGQLPLRWPPPLSTTHAPSSFNYRDYWFLPYRTHPPRKPSGNQSLCIISSPVTPGVALFPPLISLYFLSCKLLFAFGLLMCTGEQTPLFW